MPLAETGAFQNTDIELTRAGTTQRDGQQLTILHYNAFFNKFELELPRGMRMAGRSDYWGDMWIAAENTIDRATLFEEVIGEVRVPNVPTPQVVNVLRRGVFERIR